MPKYLNLRNYWFSLNIWIGTLIDRADNKTVLYKQYAYKQYAT